MLEPDMNDLAKRLHALIGQYTAFPGPILTAQCKYIKKTPSTIEPADLEKLSTYIGRAVALFSNPAKGQELEKAIARLKLS